MQDPIADLITAYHDFNATIIDELHEEPSALEFMRYVAKNRPFVVRGGAKGWKACESWDAAYLSDVMRSEDVQVAVTPYGYVASEKTLHPSTYLVLSCLVLFCYLVYDHQLIRR
jgi:jumonji domain-containing protein 7